MIAIQLDIKYTCCLPKFRKEAEIVFLRAQTSLTRRLADKGSSFGLTGFNEHSPHFLQRGTRDRSATCYVPTSYKPAFSFKR